MPQAYVKRYVKRAEPFAGSVPAPVPEELHRKRREMMVLVTVFSKYGNELASTFSAAREFCDSAFSGRQRYKPTNWLTSSRSTAKIATARMARIIFFITPGVP